MNNKEFLNIYDNKLKFSITELEDIIFGNKLEDKKLVYNEIYNTKFDAHELMYNIDNRLFVFRYLMSIDNIPIPYGHDQPFEVDKENEWTKIVNTWNNLKMVELHNMCGRNALILYSEDGKEIGEFLKII